MCSPLLRMCGTALFTNFGSTVVICTVFSRVLECSECLDLCRHLNDYCALVDCCVCPSVWAMGVTKSVLIAIVIRIWPSWVIPFGTAFHSESYDICAYQVLLQFISHNVVIVSETYLVQRLWSFEMHGIIAMYDGVWWDHECYIYGVKFCLTTLVRWVWMLLEWTLTRYSRIGYVTSLYPVFWTSSYSTEVTIDDVLLRMPLWSDLVD